MNRQPDRRLARRRPVDAVSAVWRDIDKVAGLQAAWLDFIGKTERRFTLQEEYPLAFRLVVPEVGRTAVAGRYDALDAQPRPGKQFGKLLGGQLGR